MVCVVKAFLFKKVAGDSASDSSNYMMSGYEDPFFCALNSAARVVHRAMIRRSSAIEEHCAWSMEHLMLWFIW